MIIDLSEKVVLITGASGGIGRAIALQFSDANARVAVHYNTNLEGAEKTLSILQDNNHHLVHGNISDPESVRNIVNSVVEKMGRLDILVNNAAIVEQFAIDTMSYEEWQAMWHRTLDINLKGPAYLTFCAALQMKNQSGGKIINISSRGAFRGEPNAPAYGASKAGLNAFGQSMAVALAHHNIFIYTIAPGFVDTERVAPILDGPEGNEIRAQSPLERVATPEEVARTAVFLASEGTDFLTGCIVDINGASYLR